MRNKYLIFLFLLVYGASGCATDIDSSFQENSTILENMNFDFMKESPNVKTKNRMDLSNIKKNEELAVVKEAINQISRFIVKLNFVQHPSGFFSDVATKDGVNNIKFPPKDNQYNYYLSTKIFDWVVHDSTTISLTIEFRGVPDKYGPYFNKFVFVKKDGVWLFDRHTL